MDLSGLPVFFLTVLCLTNHWRGGQLAFKMQLPASYPNGKPTVKCLTKVYHPNIRSGICLAVCSDLALQLWWQHLLQHVFYRMEQWLQIGTLHQRTVVAASEPKPWFCSQWSMCGEGLAKVWAECQNCAWGRDGKQCDFPKGICWGFQLLVFESLIPLCRTTNLLASKTFPCSSPTSFQDFTWCPARLRNCSQRTLAIFCQRPTPSWA